MSVIGDECQALAEPLFKSDLQGVVMRPALIVHLDHRSVARIELPPLVRIAEEIPDVMTLAPLVQHAGSGIVAHPTRSEFVNAVPGGFGFSLLHRISKPAASASSLAVLTASRAMLNSLSV